MSAGQAKSQRGQRIKVERRFSKANMAVGSYDRQAMEYANGRPQYPPQLFSFIANHVPHRRLAWDVGTGSGQAALALSEIFERVIATDVSEQQISYAPRRPNITYAVTPRAMSLEELENSVGAEGSVDLVTVAQALHWLDLDTFYGHVKHVLRKPGGVFAAWCYREPVVNPSVDCVFEEVFRASVAFWDPPRRMVDEGYATVCFPFRGVVQEGSEGESTTAPVKFWAKKEMGLEAYLNYMRSWHAYQKAKATGVDLLDEKTIALFKDAWGESDNDAKTVTQNGTSPYFCAIVGRVANRIKDGEFTLDGKTYHLPKNDGNNTLHGGKRGFDKVLWRVTKLRKGPRPSIQFTYHSRDGEQGFPGVLDVSATYTLSGPRELTLEIKAVPRTKPTPVSLAQHTYWNLAGEASNRSILSNKVTIWAHSITPVDKHLIPTGAIVPVKGTPYDFTKPTVVGKKINDVPGGYDINYVLDRPKSKHWLRRAVRVKDDFSGRVLDLWTNNIGLQFYTSNQIKKIVGKGGAIYRKYAGLVLETQAFPDAVDQTNFPSIIYRPGQLYRHVMVYKFSVKK